MVWNYILRGKKTSPIDNYFEHIHTSAILHLSDRRAFRKDTMREEGGLDEYIASYSR